MCEKLTLRCAWAIVLFCTWQAGTAMASEGSNPSVQGKYARLLKKFPCPRDREKYGQFYEYGKYAVAPRCGTRNPLTPVQRGNSRHS